MTKRSQAPALPDTKMRQARPRDESPPAPAGPRRRDRYIYIACPWAPIGGGMFKVADYLIQSQQADGPAPVAQLRPLDTRGGGRAASSMWILLTALAKLARGRLQGGLAGVHVNMAERLSLVRKSVIVIACRALGVPVVLHLHAAQLHHFYRALPAPLRAVTRWVFSLPASVLVLGTSARRFVTQELRVPAYRVEVVINGVPEPCAPRRQAEPGGLQRVLFLGNLSERKGVSDLLQALAQPGFRAGRLEVVLAGGGDLPAYRAKARALGIDGFVRFEGWCDQEQVAGLLARSDLLVLPSYDEGLPLVILEALAHAVAVVCTPVGEIASQLAHGVNAYFVPPGNVDALAAGLQEVLQRPALLEALGRNGRALYQQRFSMSRFCANVALIHQRHFGIAGQAVPPGVTAGERRRRRYIYIACPWTPMGGGMFKVADYLIQSQQADERPPAAQLQPLDTRGGGHAVFSLLILLTALARLVRGRLQGRLAGVHVNVGERLSLVRKAAIVATCRVLGVPVVLHLHAQMRPFYRSLPLRLQRMTRWVFSLPASVVVIGAASRHFVTTELGVPAGRVEIVINGVPEPAEPRRVAIPGGTQRVLFVGRLCEAKGVSDLLAALARPGFDPDRLEVTLAGGGDVAGYQAQARALGIDGFVRFRGWCDQAEVARLMAASDLLVLPSHDEVLPLVILEALAHGLAVVCTPVGEIPSLLADGVNACFVMAGNVEALAGGLQEVLRQPELLETLGRNGRALYEQQFSLSRFCANVARIHQRHFGVAGQPVQAGPLAREPAR